MGDKYIFSKIEFTGDTPKCLEEKHEKEMKWRRELEKIMIKQLFSEDEEHG